MNLTTLFLLFHDEKYGLKVLVNPNTPTDITDSAFASCNPKSNLLITRIGKLLIMMLR